MCDLKQGDLAVIIDKAKCHERYKGIVIVIYNEYAVGIGIKDAWRNWKSNSLKVRRLIVGDILEIEAEDV